MKGDDCIENISKALNFYRREKAKQKALKKEPAVRENKTDYHQLFKSPLASQSRLGKYTGTMTKQTLYNKLTYHPHNRIEELLRDKDAQIKMLNRRLTRTSPSDSRYTIIQQQLESLSRQVQDLKMEKQDLLNKREQLLRYATEQAGNVVPVDAVYDVMRGRPPAPRPLISPQMIGEPVGAPEDTFQNEDGGEGVGNFSTGPIGGDADIKQQQDEAPEGSEAQSPSDVEIVPQPAPEITPIKSEPESESDTEGYEMVEPEPQPRKLPPKPTPRQPEIEPEPEPRTLFLPPKPTPRNPPESEGIGYGSSSDVEQTNELPAPYIDLNAIDKILKYSKVSLKGISSINEMIRNNDPAIYDELKLYLSDSDAIKEIERYLPPKPVKLLPPPKPRKGPLRIEEIEEPTQEQVQGLIKVAREIESGSSQSDYPSDVVEKDFKKFDKYKDKIGKDLPLTTAQRADFMRLLTKYRKASEMTHSELEGITKDVLMKPVKKEMTQEQRELYNERRRQRYAERKAGLPSYYGKN